MGLYSSTNRMTTMFYTSMIIVTLLILALRLTVFSDMAAAASSDTPAAPDEAQSDEMSGNADFPYKMNGKIYFETPDSDGNVLIQNPDTNTYLLSINIMLPETKDSLYYSGSILPGTSIDKAKLSANGQRLENGVYKCVAEISAIDPNDFHYVKSEEADVTIYIGEKP